jgi:hypothetical protein
MFLLTRKQEEDGQDTHDQEQEPNLDGVQIDQDDEDNQVI